MDIASNIHQYLDSLKVEYYSGDYVTLQEDWRYNNIVPGYNKFYYIEKGEFYLEINGQSYNASKGDFFILPSNSLQTYYCNSNDYATKYWFHCNVTCNGKDFLELISLPMFIRVTNEKKVKNLFSKVLLCSEDNSIQSILLQKAYIIQLLALFIEKSNTTNEKLFRDEKFSLLMNYLEKNYNKPLTVQTLSDLLHYHPNYFINYFKKITGSPPLEYINNMRIAKAKKLLQMTPMSVSSISQEIGFVNPYYFSRIFKKKTGFTPSEYRSSTLYFPTVYSAEKKKKTIKSDQDDLLDGAVEPMKWGDY